MIGVFQFLELWKDEEGENKNGKKKKGRRLPVQGLYLEVEKAARALTQLFSDKRESESAAVTQMIITRVWICRQEYQKRILDEVFNFQQNNISVHVAQGEFSMPLPRFSATLYVKL